MTQLNFTIKRTLRVFIEEYVILNDELRFYRAEFCNFLLKRV